MTTYYWNTDTGAVSTKLYSIFSPVTQAIRGAVSVSVVLLQGIPATPYFPADTVSVGVVVRNPANLKAGYIGGPVTLTKQATAALGFAGAISTDTTYTRQVMHVDPVDTAVELTSLAASAAFFSADSSQPPGHVESEAFPWTVLPNLYRPLDAPADVIATFPFLGNSLATSVLRLKMLHSPGQAPVVTPHGVNNGKNWRYRVSVRAADGTSTDAQYESLAINSGATTLSSVNYNSVTWVAVPGASAYDIWRTYVPPGGTPSTLGKVATVPAGTTTYLDQGGAGDGTGFPTSNQTGAIFLSDDTYLQQQGAALVLVTPRGTVDLTNVTKYVEVVPQHTDSDGQTGQWAEDGNYFYFYSSQLGQWGRVQANFNF